jgi:hypothetical protein
MAAGLPVPFRPVKGTDIVAGTSSARRVMPDQIGNRGWQPGCLIAFLALVAVFVGFGAVMVACGDSLAHMGNGFSMPNLNLNLGPHRAPIPIPHRSCASLRAVQLTAADAGQSWGTVLLSNDAAGWQTFASQLGPRLARFDVALRAAIPNVPAPVAAELRDVIQQVDIGRRQLPHAKSSAAYTSLTNNAVFIGYEALGEASDLVGNACGFTLAPGLDVILPTTTTVR